jgi:hypothetical protein
MRSVAWPAKLDGLNRRLLAVWAILTAITVAYVAIDRSASDHGARTASTVVTISAVVLALVKVRIIMGEFMEVRGATKLLRFLANLWIVIMGTTMIACYLIGKAHAG